VVSLADSASRYINQLNRSDGVGDICRE